MSRWVAFAAALGLAACGDGSGVAAPASSAADARWFASWTTAHTGAHAGVSNQTLRLVVQLSAGGDALRLQLRNKFGTAPVVVERAAVGLVADGAALVPGSNRPLTFGGAPGAIVEAGRDVLSDPVALATEAQQNIAVSLHLPGFATPSQDGNAYMTSYATALNAGDHVLDESATPFVTTTSAMILVGAVDVRSTALTGAIVAVGGSTTDGVGSDGRTLDAAPSPTAAAQPQPECNPCRWTDFLARRIVHEVPPERRKSVGNEGVLGNTTSHVLARYDGDVLAQSGLTHVILYSGANDLGVGSGDSAETIIANLTSAIDRAHARGAAIIVATINPRAAYTPEQNARRHAVNDWIRAACGGRCDGVADFDAVLAWSGNPDVMDPHYDSGDDIHPTAAGYQAMADAIDLALLSD
jgi:lysophospholipase L1-like esterase